MKYEDFKSNVYEYKISIIPLTVGSISFFIVFVVITFFNYNVASIPFFESRM